MDGGPAAVTLANHIGHFLGRLAVAGLALLVVALGIGVVVVLVSVV